MKCPMCKEPLGMGEKLTFQLETEEDNLPYLHVHHHKNDSWCWCCGSVPEEKL